MNFKQVPNPTPSARSRLSPALYTLKPLLLAMLAGLPGWANAGSCTATTPGPATCVIPAGVASVNVVAIGGGGGSGGSSIGGAGSVVTTTLNGVGGTSLNLFVGGGGGGGYEPVSASYYGGGGGGSSNVNAGALNQIIAGGGGGGGRSTVYRANGGSGGSGSGGDHYNKSGGRLYYADHSARGGSSGTGGSGGLHNDGAGTSGGGGGCSDGGAGGGLDGPGGLGGLGGGGSGGRGGDGGGGGGGGGFGGGGGGGSRRDGSKSYGGGGGGGGGSTGGTVSVASNGGVSGGAGGNGSILITWADPNTAGVPVPVTPPATPNLTSAAIAEDLEAFGSSYHQVCLTNALRTVSGAFVVYKGQHADGSAWFNVGTSPVRVLSFYPIVSSPSSDDNGALILSSTNQLTISSRCGDFTTAPALFNRDEFAALASARGLAVSITEQGLITVKSGEGIYVVRPDYWVTPDTPIAPGLVQGPEGLYRFTDSAGNSQLLRPAFLSPSASQAGAGPGFDGSFVIQLDGTALFTQSNGTQFVLSPDMVLGPLPPAFAQSKGWADGVNHYRYPMCSYASQGFTRTAK